MNTETNTHVASRRRFLTGAASTAAGLAASGLLGGGAARAATQPLTYGKISQPRYLNLPGLMAGKDVQVLNYALTLEDLEADLYVQALQRVTTGGVNAVGKTIPGLGLSWMEPDVSYYTEFGPVEAKHRDFLRQSLNSLIHGLAVGRRKYDFGIESMTREQVLALVLDVEQTGTAAYLGAIPKFKTKLFITAAAAIQGTEARHTAILTLVQNELFNGSSPKPVAPLASDNHGIETPIDPDTVLAKVSPFIVG
jgi:hypothetical protein